MADPHNFLLEIWATAGTPAALAFLAVLGCFAIEGGRRKVEGGADGGQRSARGTVRFAQTAADQRPR